MSFALPALSDPAAQQRQNLRKTTLRALELMESLGRQELGSSLQELGWTFSFDRARRRLGSCRWQKRRSLKQITVSRYYATHLGIDALDERGLRVIEDVIRHEIAHAIDFETRGRSDHGPRWKAICRRVGADPTRLYEAPEWALPTAPGKYLATCPGCGRQTTYYRAPSRPRACRDCCERHAGGRYDDRFRLVISQRY